jgi:DNA repair protein RecN (Recombination protein N)
LERLARIDPDMNEAAVEGQSLVEQLRDLSRTVQDYAEDLEFNPERLQDVEERLELINNLRRKYGDTIEQIISFGERAGRELDEIGSWEIRTASLEKQEEALLREIGTLATVLSEKRKAAGEQMARQIEMELGDLRMTRARFGVALAQVDAADGAILPDDRRVAFDATGIDQIEFMVSANPGEPLKPLVKVASGGETARLMLALKSVLTQADATPTLIFDEIDQGIGGRVGAIVGQKLWMLTRDLSTTDDPAVAGHQVLCITHLPQLAAFGDQHFTVNKQVVMVNGEERTSTVVCNLGQEARVEELMQMLGAHSEAGRQSIAEMMRDVAAVKGEGKVLV